MINNEQQLNQMLKEKKVKVQSTQLPLQRQVTQVAVDKKLSQQKTTGARQPFIFRITQDNLDDSELEDDECQVVKEGKMQQYITTEIFLDTCSSLERDASTVSQGDCNVSTRKNSLMTPNAHDTSNSSHQQGLMSNSPRSASHYLTSFSQFGGFGEETVEDYDCDSTTQAALSSFSDQGKKKVVVVTSQRSSCEPDDEDSVCELASPTKKTSEDTIKEVPAISAAEFELRVCSQLDQIKKSYQATAERYEKVIEQNDEIIKLCKKSRRHIKKTKVQRTKELTHGFKVIVGELRASGMFRPNAFKDPRPAWK